jgi:chromosome segregation ATPase
VANGIDSVCSKLDALAQADKTNINPTGEFRTFIGDQLKTLQSDMLKYDEVIAEGRKAQEVNNGLSQQLMAEQQHTHQLNEQLSGLRRNEQELQARTTQLEHQLVESRNKTTEVSILEQNMEELRQQVKTVQDQCNTAKAELEKTERNLQKRDRKLADAQVSDVPNSLIDTAYQDLEIGRDSQGRA